MHFKSHLARWLTPLLLTGLCLSALAHGTQSHAAEAGLLRSTAPDRATRLLAAAKAEGSLTLYTSIAEKDIAPLIEPFQKKYGIKVNVWRASGDSVLARIVNETRAKRYTADALHIGSVELEALSREKLLQAVASPHFAELIPGTVPAHKEWASTVLSLWTQAYNTQSVKAAELPKTYADLLDPRWKGRLGYEVENVDWFVTVVKSMGEAQGLQFFRDLASRNGISVRKGHSNLTNMVAAGEVPMALTVYNYMPEQFKKRGAPIDSLVLQPAVARANGIAVLRHATHPNAAALFMDYLLGEAQPAFASLDYLPTNTKVDSPWRSIKMNIVDPVESLDHREKWRKLYDEIIMRGGRP